MARWRAMIREIRSQGGQRVILLPRNRQDLIAVCGEKSPVPAFALFHYRRKTTGRMGFRPEHHDVLWLYNVVQVARKADMPIKHLRNDLLHERLPRPDLTWDGADLFDIRYIKMLRRYWAAWLEAPFHNRDSQAVKLARTALRTRMLIEPAPPFGFTREQIAEMRVLHWCEGVLSATLAAQYGIDQRDMVQILNYRMWRYLYGHKGTRSEAGDGHNLQEGG